MAVTYYIELSVSLVQTQPGTVGKLLEERRKWLGD
jgi:hypothetical protein